MLHLAMCSWQIWGLELFTSSALSPWPMILLSLSVTEESRLFLKPRKRSWCDDVHILCNQLLWCEHVDSLLCWHLGSCPACFEWFVDSDQRLAKLHHAATKGIMIGIDQRQGYYVVQPKLCCGCCQLGHLITGCTVEYALIAVNCDMGGNDALPRDSGTSLWQGHAFRSWLQSYANKMWQSEALRRRKFGR